MNAEENFLFYTYSENRNNCSYPHEPVFSVWICHSSGKEQPLMCADCVQTCSSTYEFYICFYTECYQIWPPFLNS